MRSTNFGFNHETVIPPILYIHAGQQAVQVAGPDGTPEVLGDRVQFLYGSNDDHLFAGLKNGCTLWLVCSFPDRLPALVDFPAYCLGSVIT
ncbi:MAG: hypothetical protein IPH12_16100 [Saprospirales bacterium]|nr:hypothetical protein [Saprospirales bacterium]MBK8920108.1 hypothetical protein [Saprospirales bacterium]